MSTELSVLGVHVVGDLPEEAKDRLPHDGDTWSYDELVSMLEAVAEQAGDAKAYVLVGGYGDDWFDRHLFAASAEGVDLAPVQLSLSEEEPQPAVLPGEAAPEQPLRLRCEATPFIDELESEAGSAHVGEAPTELVLPFFFASGDRLLDVATRLCAELEEDVGCLVRVDGRLGWLTLDPDEGAALDPVFCWHEDEDLRTWIRSELAPPVAPARRASPPFPSFAALRDHVRERYTPASREDEDEDVASIVWSWSDTERTQLVDIEARTVADEDWIVIASPFASVDQVPLATAFEQVAERVSSFARMGDRYYLRLVLPLEALPPARLDAALGVVAQEADDAEAALLGTDEY